MTPLLARRVAALSGFLAVALGAMGAHALQAQILAHAGTELWQKAVLFHLAHTLALLWLAGRPRVALGPFLCFAGGILLFSGSLYLYALTRTGWLVAFTPFGGVAFLVGWMWLAICPDSCREGSGS